MNLPDMRYAIKVITKSLLYLAFFAQVLIMSSCKQEVEEYPAPTIRFVSGSGTTLKDTTLLLNEAILIGIEAQTGSDQKLTHFHTTLVKDSIHSSIDTALYINTFSYSRQIVKGIANTETRTYYVRDRDGRKSNEITLILRLDSSSVYGGVHYLPSIILGAQNHPSTGSFCSIHAGRVYSMAEAFADQSSVTLLYYYDLIESDKNTIASPGANLDASVFQGAGGLANWTVRNTTRFVYQENITPLEFEHCRNDSLILANTFEFEAGKRKAKTLSGGQVWSFVTESGIKGLFRIKEVQDAATGFVEISIKMMNQ
jgi:hypothetical protein